MSTGRSGVGAGEAVALAAIASGRTLARAAWRARGLALRAREGWRALAAWAKGDD